MFELHHIDIWINKIEESINFYKILGFNLENKVKEEEKGIILMRMKDIVLELKYHLNETCIHNKPICGDNKVFGLSVKDINKAKKFVQQNISGKSIEIKKGILGKNYFIIDDPNGNRIEFIEK